MKRMILAMAMLVLGCGQAGDVQRAEVESIVQKLQVPGAQPRLMRPGAAAFNGNQFFCYVDGDLHLRVVRRDGVNFVEQTILESTEDGAQIAAFNGALYLVWVGTDHQMNTLRTFDGINWQDKRTFSFEVPPRLANTPALVVYGNALNIFVNSKIERDDSRFWSLQQFFSFDGVNWPESQFAEYSEGHGSPFDPAVATLGNNLVLAWTTPEFRLARQVYSPSTGWSPIVITNEHLQPNLVSAGDSVILLGRSFVDSSFNETHFYRSTDGFSFQFLGPTDFETNGTPTGVSAGSNSVDFLYIPVSGGLFRETFSF